MAKDKKNSSGGASGSTGRGKPQTPQGSAAGIDPAERDARTYTPLPLGPPQRAFLKNIWDSHSDMTPDQEDALKLYKGDGFVQMNALLREPETWDTFMNESSKGLTEIGIENRKQTFRDATQELINAPTKQLGIDTVLYRGLDFPVTKANALRDLIYDGLQNGTLVGSKFTDKGFGSTSLSPTASSFQKVQLRIRAPKETKVWSPDPNGTHGEENEILLKNNTSYTIRGTSKGPYGSIVLDVDID